MSLLNQVKSYIEKHDMIVEGDKVVIGLSGGVDSVALLLLLHDMKDDLGLELKPMHVQHHMRDDADADLQFCESLCQRLELDLEVAHVDVPQLVEKEKLSEEDAARRLRYSALEKCRIMTGAKTIAVAHHKEDQAETILHRLIRGSGSAGLSGMKAVNGAVIRPLLDVRKDQLITYVVEAGVGHATDESNTDTKYTRNRIRHELLPMLESFNDNIVETLIRTGSTLREDDECLQELANVAYENAVRNQEKMTLSISMLEKESVSIRKRVIRLALERTKGSLKNIESTHLNRIMALMDQQSGKQVPVVEGLVVKKEYDSLIFLRMNDEEKNSPLDPVFLDSLPITRYIQNANMTMSVRVLNESEYKGLTIYKDSFKKAPDLYTKWFDYDKIKANLVLRTRVPGDRITVNENGDSKLLKKYFTDEKIPAGSRERIPVLASGQDILWVLGFRSSEGYKVSDTTKNVLEVKLIKEDENGKD